MVNLSETADSSVFYQHCCEFGVNVLIYPSIWISVKNQVVFHPQKAQSV